MNGESARSVIPQTALALSTPWRSQVMAALPSASCLT